MSRCRNCNVEILDENPVCPLCQSVLEQTEELENMYPDARLANQKLLFASRIFLFCALMLEFVLINIDFRVESQIRWSILVGVGLLYIYMVIRYAIIGKSGYRSKTIVLTVLAILCAVAADFATGYHGWSVDYVMTSVSILVDVAILCLMIFNRRNWQSYMMWQIFMILCSVIPLVLVALGLERNAHMAFLPIIVSGFLFMGTMMIGGRRAWLELKRRFHIS